MPDSPLLVLVLESLRVPFYTFHPYSLSSVIACRCGLVAGLHWTYRHKEFGEFGVLRATQATVHPAI